MGWCYLHLCCQCFPIWTRGQGSTKKLVKFREISLIVLPLAAQRRIKSCLIMLMGGGGNDNFQGKYRLYRITYDVFSPFPEYLILLKLSFLFHVAWSRVMLKSEKNTYRATSKVYGIPVIFTPYCGESFFHSYS